jgi:hypothetical protein
MSLETMYLEEGCWEKVEIFKLISAEFCAVKAGFVDPCKIVPVNNLFMVEVSLFFPKKSATGFVEHRAVVEQFT